MKPISIKGLRAASSIFALLFILNASGCAGAAGSPSVPEAVGTTAADGTMAAAETTAADGTTTAAVPQTSTSAEQTAEAATTKALEKRLPRRPVPPLLRTATQYRKATCLL